MIARGMFRNNMPGIPEKVYTDFVGSGNEDLATG